LIGGYPIIIQLPYGKSSLPLHLPASQPYDIISYLMDTRDPDVKEGAELVRQALCSPIGTSRLRELAAGRKNAVILISDGTRLCPSELLLPPLLEELNAAGIQDDAIDIIIALGLHRKHTPDEIRQLVGLKVFNRIRVHNHSSAEEDCVRVGKSTAGTPIELNRMVVEAELRIVTGNIEPHALVGVSGGIKALIPGTASQKCIEYNHSLSMRSKPAVGRMDNPIHCDLEEALRFVAIDFMLNVVVDHERNVLGAVAGHVTAAHRAGVELAVKRFIVPVGKKYDLVIVSPGGSPKDLQLYQSIKALRNASIITKQGGTILLVAECPEMFGNGIFQYWIETMTNRERMVAKLQQQFVLGAHKVLHLNDVLSQQSVYLYSSLHRPLVELLGMHPVADLQSWFELYIGSEGPELGIMPYGSLTYPVIEPLM
jgi:nickel-dependent lactate racemase